MISARRGGRKCTWKVSIFYDISLRLVSNIWEKKLAFLDEGMGLEVAPRGTGKGEQQKLRKMPERKFRRRFQRFEFNFFRLFQNFSVCNVICYPRKNNTVPSSVSGCTEKNFFLMDFTNFSPTPELFSSKYLNALWLMNCLFCFFVWKCIFLLCALSAALLLRVAFLASIVGKRKISFFFCYTKARYM